ncbi:hypothetical protein [Erythrobacter oryzae]|uniref:hypothetical protein n=1 Tax=Erythrobacter oryzae TaxID=3019556 RepID=UPI0025535D51|nr:hypothetical protein [Erythrobacter sp. COR-2]
MATASIRAEPSTFPSRYAVRQHEADAGALALSVLASVSLLGLVLLAAPAVREAAPEALAVFSLGAAGASGGEDAQPVEARPAPRREASRAQPDTRPAPVAAPATTLLEDEAAPVPSTQPGPEPGGVIAVAQSLAAVSPETVSVIAGSGGGGAGAGAVDDAGGRAGSAGNRGQRRILTASWAPDMDFSRDHLLYPRAAREQRVEGTAWLYCFVTRRDRVKDCRLIGEEPAGYGFGKAALKGRSGMRIRLHDEKGQQVHDEWVVVTKTFNLD